MGPRLHKYITDCEDSSNTTDGNRGFQALGCITSYMATNRVSSTPIETFDSSTDIVTSKR